MKPCDGSTVQFHHDAILFARLERRIARREENGSTQAHDTSSEEVAVNGEYRA